MKQQDLSKRIEELERRVKELEERPVEYQWHFLHEVPSPFPIYPPTPYWLQTYCTYCNTSGTTTSWPSSVTATIGIGPGFSTTGLT